MPLPQSLASKAGLCSHASHPACPAFGISRVAPSRAAPSHKPLPAEQSPNAPTPTHAHGSSRAIAARRSRLKLVSPFLFLSRPCIFFNERCRANTRPLLPLIACHRRCGRACVHHAGVPSPEPRLRCRLAPTTIDSLCSTLFSTSLFNVFVTRSNLSLFVPPRSAHRFQSKLVPNAATRKRWISDVSAEWGSRAAAPAAPGLDACWRAATPAPLPPCPPLWAASLPPAP